MTLIATRFAGTRRPVHEPALEALLADGGIELEQQFHNWIGSSGRRYIHTVYPLLTCPMLPAANVVYVRRSPDGSRQALEVGATHSDAPSINRARIRQRAAQLGANEVHVHLLAETELDRLGIQLDLNSLASGRAG